MHKKCGDCAKWMTQQCPKEPKNKQNFNVRLLPSMNTPSCIEFAQSKFHLING
jgi:hypothetical protein